MGDAFVATLGGRRLPVRQAGRTYANVDYRDHVEGDELPLAHPLRAVAHYEGPAVVDVSTLDEYYSGGRERSVSRLIQSKKPIDVFLVEDFDPTGRVSEARGSFAQWRPVADNEYTDGYDARARPVLSAETGHANGELLVDGALTLWADGQGVVHPVLGGAKCRPFSGYADGQGKLFLACEGTTIEAADGSGAVLQLPGLFLGFPQEDTHYKGVGSFPPVPGQAFYNPDTIGVGKNGHMGVLRLPSGAEPATVDDPAWLLTKDGLPEELAPWSTLQMATSAACAHADDGVRAIVQTPIAWVNVAGASRLPESPGMRALVRWSKERVCLEAIELGYRGVQGSARWRHPVTEVMLVARFVGRDPGAGLVAFNASTAYRETVRCKLSGGSP
jgi:hypothetical protein